MCAFFHSREQEYEAFLPFIRRGLERGEKAIQIVDPRLQEDHLRRLAESGINVPEAQERKQLQVLNWNDAYLRGGRFDHRDMQTLMRELLTGAEKKKFPLTQLVAHMEWAKEDRPGVEDLIEYESKLNYFAPKYPDVLLCVYDVTRFDAETIIDVLRTHPMVMIGGLIHENAFFVPPDEFVKEHRAFTQGEKVRKQLETTQRQLADNAAELKKFMDVVVGREMKMAALEREIERLRKLLDE